MTKKVSILTLYIMILLLLFSGCQNSANPAASLGEDQEIPEPKNTEPPQPTDTPLQEPTDTPPPTATPDPRNLSFGTRANELSNFKDGGAVFGLAWHPDSRLFANTGIGKVLIWDTKSLSHAFILEGHTALVTDVAWSPDGNILASLSLDETVRLWQDPDYQEVGVLEISTAISMDWAADSQHLSVGTMDGSIQIWDIQQEELSTSWKNADQDGVFLLDWSPDQPILATGQISGTVFIWDAEEGKVIQILTDPDESEVTDLAWAPNGSYLATSHKNGKVHLWDPYTWEIVRSIDALEDGVSTIAWSPDSLILTTGGVSNSIPMWEAASGELIRGIAAAFTTTFSIAWSPNGNFVTVGTAGRGGLTPNYGGAVGWYSGIQDSESMEDYQPNPEAGIINLWVRTQ
jgi:WD40 repeat protein